MPTIDSNDKDTCRDGRTLALYTDDTAQGIFSRVEAKESTVVNTVTENLVVGGFATAKNSHTRDLTMNGRVNRSIVVAFDTTIEIVTVRRASVLILFMIDGGMVVNPVICDNETRVMIVADTESAYTFPGTTSVMVHFMPRGEMLDFFKARAPETYAVWKDRLEPVLNG